MSVFTAKGRSIHTSLSRRNFIMASGALALGLLSGCVAQPVVVPDATTSAPAAETTEQAQTTELSGTRTITHPLGTSEVPVAPQRIIAMHNEAIANIMLQLGVTPLASVNGPDFTTIGDVTFPESVVSIGAYDEPNLEEIASLKPDLIISSMGMHDDIYEQLSAIAPTVPVYDIGAEDALATSRTVADLTGKSDVLDDQIAAYEARVADIHSRLEPLLPTAPGIAVALRV